LPEAEVMTGKRPRIEDRGLLFSGRIIRFNLK